MHGHWQWYSAVLICIEADVMGALKASIIIKGEIVANNKGTFANVHLLVLTCKQELSRFSIFVSLHC